MCLVVVTRTPALMSGGARSSAFCFGFWFLVRVIAFGLVGLDWFAFALFWILVCACLDLLV